MITVTFCYGPEGALTRQIESGTTVSQALEAGVRGGLGVPENVSVIVDGVTKTLNYVLGLDGEEILFETAPASKA